MNIAQPGYQKAQTKVPKHAPEEWRKEVRVEGGVSFSVAPVFGGGG